MSGKQNGNLITIGIPVYNSANYITTTLDTVRKQKGSFDVVIRDDCSPDNTVEIISGYITEHSLPWVLVEGKENEGCSLARRRLLDDVKTPFIFFVDADDLLIGDNVIEKITPLLEKHDLVYINRVSRFDRHNFSTNNLLRDIYNHNIGDHINCFVKADIFREITWYAPQYSEVYYLMIAAVLKSKTPVYYDEPLYRVRTNPKSLTHYRDPKLMRLETWFYKNKVHELLVAAGYPVHTLTSETGGGAGYG